MCSWSLWEGCKWHATKILAARKQFEATPNLGAMAYGPWMSCGPGHVTPQVLWHVLSPIYAMSNIRWRVLSCGMSYVPLHVLPCGMSYVLQHIPCPKCRFV